MFYVFQDVYTSKIPCRKHQMKKTVTVTLCEDFVFLFLASLRVSFIFTVFNIFYGRVITRYIETSHMFISMYISNYSVRCTTKVRKKVSETLHSPHKKIHLTRKRIYKHYL